MFDFIRRWWSTRATSGLRNPAPWLKEVFGAEETDAGIAVNEETALKFTAVFAAVRVLGESLASLPLHLYRRMENDGRERALEHPAYNIVHDQPNAYQSSYEFRLLMMTWLLLHGNSFAEIERDQAGNLQALWPLHPGRMRLKAEGNGVTYEYFPPQGERVKIPFENVLHLRGLTTDGWIGLSPISAARQSIGLSLAAEKFGAKFFGAGSRVGGVLKVPRELTPQQTEELRTAWEGKHLGPDAFHKIAILSGMMEFTPFQIKNADAEFIATRRLGIEDIARIFRIPGFLLGDLSQANYSNTSALDRSFAKYSLLPWTTNIEQAMSLKLLGPRLRRTFYFEHDLNAILKGDPESRMRAYQAGIYSGVYSPNEVRRLENLPPRADGDLYLQPSNTFIAPFFPPPQQGAQQ